MRFILVTLLILVGQATASTDNGVIRYAVIAGVNNGGQDRVQLKFATKDAESIYSVFTSLGGLPPENTNLLIEPDAEQLLSAIDDIKRRVSESKLVNKTEQNSKRVEFIFYYSGHSDEKSLLMGDETVSYTQLKGVINTVGADVRVAILDSCASGAFTRLKGGTHVKPFLANTATDVSGYAYLASSSADESAQESDAIGGAYFTHYMVSALRGAGDLSEDKKITLNEAYHFAFTETLAQTEGSRYGAQHAAYDIQLSGEGDLVLTDLAQTSGELILDEDLIGRIYIRDAGEHLVVELNKSESKPLKIGLEPGEYKVTLEREGQVYRIDGLIIREGVSVLGADDLESVELQVATARGGSVEPIVEIEDIHFKTSLTEVRSNPPLKPGIKQRVKWDFNLFGNNTYEINGLSAGLFLTKTEHNTKGAQISSFYNSIGGNLNGASIAGFVNAISGDVSKSLVLSGGLNDVKSSLDKSVMVGTVNIIDGDTKSAVLASAMANITMEGTNHSVLVSGIANYSEADIKNGAVISTANIIRANVSSGAMIASIANYAEEVDNGVQIAAIVNYANEVDGGAQISAIANHTKKMVGGAQVSAIVNHAKTFEGGAQIGLVNIAKEISGAQFGLVNVASELDGPAFGLLNFIGNGRHSVGITWNELDMPVIDFKLGGKGPYTQWAFGIRPDGDLASVSLGLGARILQNDSAYLESELYGTQYLELETCNLCDWEDLNFGSAASLRLTAGNKILKNLNLVASVSFNKMYDNQFDEQIDNFNDKYLNDPLSINGNSSFWVGYSIGLEFM